MSIRGDRFEFVVQAVQKHIKEYTIPRYGDSPEDRLENIAPAGCVQDAGRYADRFLSPERYEGEKKQDCLKAIQYWGEAYLKMIELENQ